MPRHSAPQQPTWLRPRLVVAFVVATAGLVTAVWLPTRNDSADAAERNRSTDRLSRSLPAFADDFSGRRGSTVDPGKWALRTDRVNGGVQFSQSVRNARLDGDGKLVIVLRDEDRDAFSTARLYTRGTLRSTAGHVEARIKVPADQGLRPTFELVSAVRTSTGALNLLADPVTDDDFHTYAVDWKPGEVTFSVDGSPVRREALRGVDTGQPFRLALSLTVGDNRRGADLPARMVVDSVSFSGADASAEPPATTPPTSEVPTTPPAGEPTTAPTTEPPTSEPTTPPTTTPPAATTPPTTPPTSAPPAAAQWAPFTDYVAGQLVTFKNVEYQVLETHTSLPGWEPTALPALFKKI
ncbi:carbohydrate-binding protein [Actinoplanes sp. CA-051413]|uniref:carbohydrate-binding protein n=1 Tax=Actinoplanes sp. CA-051413 TaxID=3239899 RepID=UPI003D98B4DF